MHPQLVIVVHASGWRGQSPILMLWSRPSFGMTAVASILHAAARQHPPRRVVALRKVTWITRTAAARMCGPVNRLEVRWAGAGLRVGGPAIKLLRQQRY